MMSDLQYTDTEWMTVCSTAVFIVTIVTILETVVIFNVFLFFSHAYLFAHLVVIFMKCHNFGVVIHKFYI